ncbi:MAG: hypothetical protein A2113_02140 [Candidatus Woykebacteria bacterium GWA1_44_8]|uniref:Carbohydrate-binding module family 96 domain-containing protein n=1 Tax=Candidatus Woykebacteria bacterium GWA1_44_8 TaxID=1802591 RepID=A0A1G1W4S1_9BACT|nr:MAG: hypothetical protein A2113_02140 [Candidatus Woykebacteria bacterium GWA1_44_8]
MKQIYLPFSIFVLCFTFLFLLPKINQASATTVTLTSTADAMIQSLNPNSTYGSNSHLDVMKSYPPETDPEGKTRSLIQFNLSSIPSSATINSATLAVYLYGCGGGGWSQTVNDLRIGRNKGAWAEYTVNWSNKPSFDTGTVLNYTAPCSLVGQYHSYNVKSFVSGWLAGNFQNYGVVLYGNELSGVSWIKFFYGREDPANKPPKLTIDYTVPTQPTTPEDGDQTSSPNPPKQGVTASDEESALKSSEQTAADSATTSAAKKATSSSAEKEKTGISAAGIALLTALVLLLIAVVAGYFVYRRRKSKLSNKKAAEGRTKEPLENQVLDSKDKPVTEV